MAFVLGILTKSVVLILVADVEALRDHVAQVVCMYPRAALQIKLCVRIIHGCQVPFCLRITEQRLLRIRRRRVRKLFSYVTREGNTVTSRANTLHGINPQLGGHRKKSEFSKFCS